MAREKLCECGACKRCKHRAYMAKWYRRPGNAKRVRGWVKRYREENGDQVREKDNARHHKRDPAKARANRILNHALARGTVMRPNVCEECNTDPGLGVDGRSLIQAHHDDYLEPLDVTWLCSTCHGARHWIVRD